MTRRPPRSTRTDTLFPYTTLFRSLPVAVVLAGFEDVSPRLADWLAALRERDVDMRCLRDERPAQTPRCVVAADGERELRAAAQWALAQTLDDPQRRVAVVVTDLQSRRAAVQRIFDEVLCPQFDAPDAHSPPRPYNLTLGVPLADCCFVQTALRLLQLASGELVADALTALLCADRKSTRLNSSH